MAMGQLIFFLTLGQVQGFRTEVTTAQIASIFRHGHHYELIDVQSLQHLLILEGDLKNNGHVNIGTTDSNTKVWMADTLAPRSGEESDININVFIQDMDSHIQSQPNFGDSDIQSQPQVVLKNFDTQTTLASRYKGIHHSSIFHSDREGLRIVWDVLDVADVNWATRFRVRSVSQGECAHVVTLQRTDTNKFLQAPLWRDGEPVDRVRLSRRQSRIQWAVCDVGRQVDLPLRAEGEWWPTDDTVPFPPGQLEYKSTQGTSMTNTHGHARTLTESLATDIRTTVSTSFSVPGCIGGGASASVSVASTVGGQMSSSRQFAMAQTEATEETRIFVAPTREGSTLWQWRFTYYQDDIKGETVRSVRVGSTYTNAWAQTSSLSQRPGCFPGHAFDPWGPYQNCSSPRFQIHYAENEETTTKPPDDWMQKYSAGLSAEEYRSPHRRRRSNSQSA